MSRKTPYLYLTTEGRYSEQPREIEIWYTRYRGNYYIISYLFERAHWIQNIRRNPQVSFRVGEDQFWASARILDGARESELVASVKRLSEQKYGWSDGLVVEITLPG